MTIFVLTFFTQQAYAHYRSVYFCARAIQGRINDVCLLLAVGATRGEGEGATSTYSDDGAALVDFVRVHAARERLRLPDEAPSSRSLALALAISACSAAKEADIVSNCTRRAATDALAEAETSQGVVTPSSFLPGLNRCLP